MEQWQWYCCGFRWITHYGESPVVGSFTKSALSPRIEKKRELAVLDFLGAYPSRKKANAAMNADIAALIDDALSQLEAAGKIKQVNGKWVISA